MNQNQIQVFENTDFGRLQVINVDGEPYFIAKEVCDVLGYTNSRKAVADHVDDDDKNTVTIRDGKGNPNKTVINESGVYSLIIGSKLPEAKKFKHWVTAEVLPSIRKTGKYSAHKERDEVKEMNAKVRMANALHKLAKSDTITESHRRVLIAQAVELLTGLQIPLDKSEKTYSAGEVGKMFGVTANKIGRIANRNGLKTKEYGSYYHEVARGREVDNFRYNDKAVEKFRELIGVES